MTINAGVLATISLIVAILVDAEPVYTGVRILYATRLAGALIVATLVPLLIDRRLRR
jgi:hypothetical protein